MSETTKPWPQDASQIGFRFRGGIASQGQLNFYEAGRYRYAAARFLYTVEHFRNTGDTIERLNRMVNADFRITAPSEGSFLEVVQYFAAPIIADPNVVHTLTSIPLSKVLPWVLDKVIPKSSTNARLADIAEKQINVMEKQVALQSQMVAAHQNIAEGREETVRRQLEHDTERLRIMAGLARREGDGLRENLPAATELSNIVSKYGSSGDNGQDPDKNSEFISNELSAEVKRAEIIAPYQDKLDEISIEREQSITERVRKMMPDLGFPLQRSSELFDIEVGNDNAKIACLNRGRIKQMTTVTRDDEAVRIRGNITRLDKDHGFGRFRPAGNRSALSFTIPKEVYYPNKEAFVAAFASSEIVIQALPFRDGIGNISKLLILALE